LSNERVIEVPWALSQLPQQGLILDVGSCEATYLAAIPGPGRTLHCLDPRSCTDAIPPGVAFFRQSIVGTFLPAGAYDAVLFLSTLEHIGLPTYGQKAFRDGDRLALQAAARLLRASGRVVATVPVGRSRTATWYRQYSPDDLEELFRDWLTEIRYWAYDGARYEPVDDPAEVARREYRESFDEMSGAGAVAGILATPLRTWRAR
jgi:hypothetical protein